MYVRRWVALPAAGKAGAMQQAVEALVLRRQEQGFRVGMFRAEISADYPAFTLEVEFDDLDAVEAYARLSQQEQRDSSNRRAPVLQESARAPFRYELYSVQLPMPATTAKTEWNMRTLRRPLAGQGRDLGAATVERARAQQAEGARLSVLSLIVGPGSISLVTVHALERLAEWESINARRDDPAAAEFFRQESAMQAGPVERELYEVMIPYPLGP